MRASCAFVRCAGFVGGVVLAAPKCASEFSFLVNAACLHVERYCCCYAMSLMTLYSGSGTIDGVVMRVEQLFCVGINPEMSE